jgi:hypothetical protein
MRSIIAPQADNLSSEPLEPPIKMVNPVVVENQRFIGEQARDHQRQRGILRARMVP